MKQFKFVSAWLAVSVAAFALPAQAAGTWGSTLQGRDSNFNAVTATDASAVYLYDATLDVTWLRNANANGAMNWTTATTWAANLSTGSGANTVSDWRLPTMTVANPNPGRSDNGSTDLGFNVPGSSSEMASLFFNTLGNKSDVDTSGAYQVDGGLTNVGSFQNMQSYDYWLGTEYAPDSRYAWGFNTNYGYQSPTTKYGQFFALAVRPGDVVMAAVPEPETYLMLLIGLGVMGVLSRRRSRALGALAL